MDDTPSLSPSLPLFLSPSLPLPLPFSLFLPSPSLPLSLSPSIPPSKDKTKHGVSSTCIHTIML